MKKLARLIAHRRQLVFLDFEGTQHSHEMIALAAIKATIGEDLAIKKSYKGIHYLVRPKKEVGHYVTKLTNITEVDVVDKGISYAKALQHLRNYAGKAFEKTAFIIFGNHDVRILNQSFHYSPDADEKILKTITKNTIDFSLFLSEFIKDDHGNPLSIINNLAIFQQPFNGQHHHPLDDAKNLMNLYRQVLLQKDVIFNQYLKVLMRYRHIPEPVKVVLNKLLANEKVDQSTLFLSIKEYLG